MSSDRKDPWIGRTLEDRYVIRARLGAGGMGTVYTAEQLRVSRTVAVKILENIESQEGIERFEREAKIIAQLRHPNTLKLIDFGRTEDGLFLVTELLTGRTLTKVIEEGPSIDTTVDILIQITHALEEAHAAGVIHRDLKPDNVFVEKVGSTTLVKVLDFGIAKVLASNEANLAPSATATGNAPGTPAYISPEQAEHGRVDARSDIYGLGLIAYELLTGRRPFSASNAYVLMAKHIRESPPALTPMAGRPELPEQLCQLVLRMLEKSPDARPRSVVEVRAGLLSPGEVSITDEDSRAQAFGRVEPKVAPGRAKLIAIAVVLATAAIGIVATKTEPPKLRSQKIPATHTQLSFTGVAKAALIHPLGEQVAYHTERPGRSGAVVLADVQASAAQPKVLFACDGCSPLDWSRDGKRLLVRQWKDRTAPDQQWALRVVRRADQVPERLPHLTRACWLKDGRIAGFRSGDAKLVTIDPKTKQETKHRLDFEFDWLIRISCHPTLDKIALLSVNDDKTRSIWTLAPDGRNARQIIRSDSIAALRYAPTGEALYFTRRAPKPGLWKIASQVEARPKLVLETPGASADLSISKDGRKMAHTRGFSSTNLWRSSKRGSGALRLTRGTLENRGPKISPDGQWVAFWRGNGSTGDIYMVATGGIGAETLQRVTSASIPRTPVAWSPKGDRLALAQPYEGSSHLFLVPIKGGEGRRLAKVNVRDRLVWAPAPHVYSLRVDYRDFLQVDVTSGAISPVMPETKQYWTNMLAVTPKQDLFAVRRVLPDQNSKLHWHGANFEQFDHCEGVSVWLLRFSNDGQTLFGFDPNANEIVAIKAKQCEQETLFRIELKDVIDVDIDSRGETWVASVRESQRDVWTIADFDSD